MAAPTETLSVPNVRWDLSALFSGIDDPKIAETWATANAQADTFAAKYRGRLQSTDLSAQELKQAIQELEALSILTDKPPLYANLLFSVQADDPKISALMAEQMEQYSALRVKLLFFELELQAAEKAHIDQLLADPLLADYVHFIHQIRKYSDHRLTEPEEVLLEEVSNTGSRAWVRMFEDVTANHTYHLTLPGATEAVEKTESEVIALLRDPDRGVRQAAADALSEGLGELSRVLTFSYNTLLADKKLEDRLRKFSYPEESRHLSNELDRATVDLVTETCRKNYDLVARFYRVKRRLLGLDELTHIDRYAPLREAKQQVSWEEAKKIVLDSFAGFSHEMANRAEEFFTKNWIDAEPRTGKGGGAFCNYITPDLHPVVMVNYLNKPDDVSTLAHELGHGVHASLSRAQTYANFHGTLPLAELASIFGEMLVFEKLMSQASREDQISMLAEKIEGIFASVFRQVAMYTFEQRCHRHRREVGELSTEQFGDIWQEELQAMFGDSIKLGDQHRAWWSYVGHFVFAPFYVYAYAFGELLTLSLYQKAKASGPQFAEDYVAMLTLAGSRDPYALMQTVGVDLRSPEFWNGGISAIERLISQFESLVGNA